MQPTSIKIIKTLKKAGHEAYWAGGCVRDILLGIKPKDYDIVTSAKPDEIEKILPKTIPVGKEFGVILAIQDGHHFEIATFRSDSGYSDGRRPDAVTFTNAKEDGLRRDFTINGMFYDPLTDKILDYVNGQKDLEARIIRFIGNPTTRVMEDHLRILRAVRFKNTLGFQYEPETYDAVKKLASFIDGISVERIQSELNKMLESKNAGAALNDLYDLGILKVILPEFEKLKGLAQPYEYHHEGDVWTHTIMALNSLKDTAPLSVKWATILHDIGKSETFQIKERIRFDSHAEHSANLAKKILNRLKYPKKIIDEVCWIVLHHMMMQSLIDMPKAKKIKWFLHPWFLNLMEVFKADAKGTTPIDLKLYDDIYKLYESTVSEIKKIPKPFLSGKEIMSELKIKSGPLVGEISEQLLHQQLEGNIKNKPAAKKWLKKFKDISSK